MPEPIEIDEEGEEEDVPHVQVDDAKYFLTPVRLEYLENEMGPTKSKTFTFCF